MNLYEWSLVLCQLEIIAKTFLFLVVIFIVWFLLNLFFLYWLCSFTVFCNMPFLVTFETILCFSFLLLGFAFFCHMAVLVTIEVLRLSVLGIVVTLSNIHGLSLPSVCHSCTCLVIILSFHKLIFLSHWCYCHFPLLECLWCSYGWIT